MKSLTKDERRRERKVLLGIEEFKKQTKNKQQEEQNNVVRGKKEENNPPKPHGCFNEVPCASGMQGEKEFIEGQGLLHLYKALIGVSGNHMV